LRLSARHHFDRARAGAPATGHLLHLGLEHVLLVDGELAREAEVVKAAGAPSLHHVEAGEVPARSASVALVRSERLHFQWAYAPARTRLARSTLQPTSPPLTSAAPARRSPSADGSTSYSRTASPSSSHTDDVVVVVSSSRPSWPHTSMARSLPSRRRASTRRG